ncbi:MAG: hypothetical protein RJA36_363 [Pseudomonadota bacterium]|jgi:hypothetical protein
MMAQQRGGKLNPWRIIVTRALLDLTAPTTHKQPASRADPHRKPRARSANVAALAKLLPPGRPACFDTANDWRDFIEHAAAAGRMAHLDGPVIWIRGSPALNPDFSYCEDCTAARQARMQGENRCLPNFLKGT